METWLRISLLLSVFGFLREIRPSEPFITDFLVDFKNVTLDEILRDVYPIGTYSFMLQTIIAFLITDFLRYKPLILVSGLSGIIVYAMLLWTNSLLNLQILEIFYGTYLASEVAYYTYVYAKVDRQHYDKVTGHTRAAMFFGRVLGCGSAQVLVYFKLMNYKDLNFITFITQIMCTVWTVTLPKVAGSIYFHRKGSTMDTTSAIDKRELEMMVISKQVQTKPPAPDVGAFELIWSQFKSSYSNVEVLQWSLWYSIGSCGFFQVTSYIQILWDTIERKEMIWNGAVEAAVTLLSAIVSLFADKIHAKILSNRSSLWILTLMTLLEGLSILLATNTNNLYVSYVGYLLFCCLYAFAITICSAEVAKRLANDTFGLVFGINTFFALVLQSILTFVIVSEKIMKLDVISQFLIYAGFYFVFAFLYILNIIFNIIMHRK